VSRVPQPSTLASVSHSEAAVPKTDDVLMISAVSMLAGIVSNLLHEGLGHGAVALLTGAKSGVLTTVAWSSDFDSRLVEAGGTLVNLAAGAMFWSVLARVKNASMPMRYFLLISCAFNLFCGTGYFLFSGVTNFGDWAVVIAGLRPHWLWRSLLVVVGATAYYAAVRVVGIELVRYVGVPRHQQRRLRKLTGVSYLSAILLSSIAGLLNPIGIQLLWQSALPATAGGQSGLLWLQYCIPKGTEPSRTAEQLGRNWGWLVTAGVLGLIYVVVLGRGIAIHHH
jgi:hypothetical protein